MIEDGDSSKSMQARPVTFAHLVRHAHTDALGVRLSGRVDPIRLSARGRDEARRLGRWLAAADLAAIYTSPLPRATETAAAIAAPHQLTPQPLEALQEIDFGDWAGRSFAELARDPRWHTFNQRRSRARVPGGEPLRQVQRRIIGAVRDLASRHCGQRFVIVSHADVIRLALLACASRRLDDYDTFTIAPASVTTLSIDGWRRLRIESVNTTPPSDHAVGSADRTSDHSAAGAREAPAGGADEGLL